MSKEQEQALTKEWRELSENLTGDMFQDMDAKERMHQIQMELTGTKPQSTEIEREGCGS